MDTVEIAIESIQGYIPPHNNVAEKRIYICPVCNKQISRMRNLREHMTVHTGERQHKCEICFKTFARRKSLNMHLKIHFGIKAYGCEICGKHFRIKNTLVTHIRTHSKERPYMCAVCNKTFPQKPNLRVHMATHSQVRPYQCDLCPKAFRRKQTLGVHMGTHFRSNSDGNKRTRRKKDDPLSATIKQEFDTCYDNYNSMTNGVYIKKECVDVEFEVAEDVNLSYSQQSDVNPTVPNLYPVYSNREFSQLDNPTEIDILKTKGYSKNTTMTCENTDINKSNELPIEIELKNNINCSNIEQNTTHIGTKGICNLEQASHSEKLVKDDMFIEIIPQTNDEQVENDSNIDIKQSDLIVKMKIEEAKHIENLQHCPICHKHFNVKANLIKHMKTHMKATPFVCPDCGKGFNQKQKLIKHMVCHVRERPFACDICKKSFSRKSYLTDHMNIHTSEITCKCEVCDRQFSRKKYLREHMKIHSEAVAYKCNVCGKGFRRKHNHFIHMRCHNRVGKRRKSGKKAKNTLNNDEEVSFDQNLVTTSEPRNFVTEVEIKLEPVW